MYSAWTIRTLMAGLVSIAVGHRSTSSDRCYRAKSSDSQPDAHCSSRNYSHQILPIMVPLLFFWTVVHALVVCYFDKIIGHTSGPESTRLILRMSAVTTKQQIYASVVDFLWSVKKYLLKNSNHRRLTHQLAFNDLNLKQVHRCHY